jgi:hypothetical protein
MKKAFKWIGILILIAVLGWVAVILAAHYVFTKRLNLSCDGQQTTTLDWQGKNSVEKIPKLESLRMEIVTYPLSKTFFFIHTSDDLFSSSDSGWNIALINEQTIMVGNRWGKENGFSFFKAVTFNRLTKTVVIERKTEDSQRYKVDKVVFEGVCKEVVPL